MVHKMKDLQSNYAPKKMNGSSHNKNINLDEKQVASYTFAKLNNNNTVIKAMPINTQPSNTQYKKNISKNKFKQTFNDLQNTTNNSNNCNNSIIANNSINSSINMNSNNTNNNNNSNTNNNSYNANINKARSEILVTSMNNSIPNTNVKVICRFRPLNDQEKKNTKQLCIDSIDEDQVEIKSKNEYGNFTFHFDKIFNTNSTQKEIYDYTAKDLIDSVLAGYNATIFAYGQTASGKTYTMQGILDNPEKEGIIPRMVRHVFHNIMNADSDIEFTVKVSIIEIYMEKIRDLIDVSKTNLNIREKDKEIYVEDLSERYVFTEEELMELIKIGNDNRVTSATKMNENSSRSHTLVILTIHQKNTKTLEAKTGKLYLVDLAGSEKISKTGSSGLTLEEAKIINKSLSTLGMVINALTDGKSIHIPYRESKLTRVLTESLGGNAKTCLIITCSPSEYNESETLSTLRFGTRAKKIKNKPKINKEVTVQELKLQIEKLEKILVLCNNKISLLEDYITGNGLVLPNLDEKMGEINEKNNECDNNNNNVIIDNNEMDVKMNEIVSKYTNSLGKLNMIEGKNKDIINKLEDANIKIADLQTIIDQKEKIEEEFEEKEKKLNAVINQLSSKLQNSESKEIIKKNLKLIDKSTLDEFYSQFKNYVLNNNPKNLKSVKDINSKVLSSLSTIIENNYTQECLSAEEIEKLNSRLQTQTVQKLEFLSCGTFLDYKDMNENTIINNITNEALLKSISEKNDKIVRLESDVKEYKEKLDLFENQLTPDERNLHKKIYTLEKNLEQVNNMYHQVVTQKSVLKIENQIFEKKLKKRNEKIGTLVKENYGLVEQLKMRDEKIAYYQKNKNITIPQVVKVIRGSGKNNNGYDIEKMTNSDDSYNE